MSSLEYTGLAICHSYLKLCTSKLCSIACLYSSPTPLCHSLSLKNKMMYPPTLNQHCNICNFSAKHIHTVTTNYTMSICYDQSFFCNLVLRLNVPFSSGQGAGVSAAAAAAAGNTSSWFINGQYPFCSFFTLKNLILIQQSSSIPLSQQSSSSSSLKLSPSIPLSWKWSLSSLSLKLSPSIPLSWQWSLSSSSLRVLWYCRDLIHAGWHFIFVTHVILY